MAHLLKHRAVLAAATTAACLLLAASSPAQGIIVSRMPEAAPLQQGDVSVTATVTDRLARTRLKQDFYNTNSTVMEADYFFPVPKGAQITDFVLMVNGRPTKAEAIEAGQARKVYEDIVRKMKDPGLVEWLEAGLYRVRIYPIPARGTQTIELEWAQGLEADQGMLSYTFPLRNANPASPADKPRPGMAFSLTLQGSEAPRNVQSPTHRIDTAVQKDNSVLVTVAPDSLASQNVRQFRLDWQATKSDLAMAVQATRPRGTEDGFFSLTLSPPWKPEANAVVPSQDVIFVMDTSGSMADNDKIGQARRTLTTCLRRLRPDDRFAVITFATDVSGYEAGLTSATAENIGEACDRVQRLQARGGTNISEALQRAMELRAKSGDRRTTVLFVTDGMPTVGNTNTDAIAKLIKSESGQPLRVFTFGVGYDVNTKLLDRIADDTEAAADYVRPGEDLELPVSRLFDKVSLPAFTSAQLVIRGVVSNDLYPPKVPDLFYGTQQTLIGRYSGEGTGTIVLKGKLNGRDVQFEVAQLFPAKSDANAHIETLWATRKIGYLVDTIRRSGESKELKDEVLALGKKYGIATPYQSLLVTEDTPVNRPVPEASFDAAAPSSGRMFSSLRSPTRGRAARADGGSSNYSPAPAAAAMPAESGAAAVELSKASMMQKATASMGEIVRDKEQESASSRRVSGRRLSLQAGVWVDDDLTEKDRTDSPNVLKVRYLSTAWFDMAAAHKDLKSILATGDRLRFRHNGLVIVVSPDEGESDHLPDVMLQRLK